MKSSPVAILDIGSDRVLGGVLTRDRQKGKESLLNYLFTTQKDLPYQEILDPARLLQESLVAAKQVIEEMAKVGTKIEQVHCFLASPFYFSQTRIAKYQKEIAFTITNKLLDDLIKAETSKDRQAGARLLDREIMQIKLNRYVVAKPERKRANELELALFFSQVEEKIAKQLEELIHGRLHSRRIAFHAGVLTLFAAIRDLMAERPNALILQVSGEITELSLLSDHILAETVSYPLGYNFLIRDLSTRLNSPAAEIYSRLKLHLAGEIKETESGKFAEMLGEFGVRFLAAAKEMFRVLGENHFLPSEIFLVLDERFAQVFERWLKEVDLRALGIMRKNFTVNLLRADCWTGWQLPKVGSVIPDISLLLDGMFCARMTTF